MKKITSVLVHLSVLSILLLPVLTFSSASLVHAADDSTNSSVKDINIHIGLKNPLTGTNSLQDFLVKILNAAVLLLSPVIVLMLIYAGFQFVRAQGAPEEIQAARRTLTYTLIGAAIVLGAAGFSKIIQSTISQF